MAKPCKGCGSIRHTAFACPRRPRKPLKTNKPLRAKSTLLQRKPIKRVGKVTQKWMDTRSEWVARYGSEGHVCHYCGWLLSDNQFLIDDDAARKLTLDHLDARVRQPGLRYTFDNLVPACGPCNTMKGSLAHEEYLHACHSPLPYSPVGTKTPLLGPI